MKKSMIKFSELPQTLPAPILEEFERLHKIDQDNYGMVFAVRDLYETVLKVICLAICSLMEAGGDDSFCKVLFSPKQMSFGDWVNDLPNALRKSDYTAKNPPLGKYLKKLMRFYNSSGIVKWRNDFIGHGLMSEPEDENFFLDAEGKIKALIDFLKDVEIPSEILGLDFDNMAPFMYREDDNFYLYESVTASGAVFYANQTRRRRVLIETTYVAEKRKKYFDQLNITQGQLIRNRDIYLSEEDFSIDGYHLSPYYKKPEYMLRWLVDCLNGNPGGIFLMQGGRGTGKSSFVLACDELNQHGKQKISLKSDDSEVSVRAYYCNRINFSNINDFTSYIGEVLNTLPDGNTIRSRKGGLPDKDTTLIDTLLFYREQYEHFLGREKLILFIDGIDELTSKGWSILDALPEKADVPEGVYLVLTCRSEAAEMPPIILDFIHGFPFTDSVVFHLRNENHLFMVSVLDEMLGTPHAENEQLAAAFDDRLSVIPLLLNMPGNEAVRLLEESKTGSTLDYLAESYLSRLKIRYGEQYYREFIRFLMTISEELEGLSLSEISILSLNQDTSIKTICFLKDASPFLTEYRSYRGNLYWISRPEYQKLLRKMYPQEFAELLYEWRNQLFQLNPDGKIYIVEADWDALLYLCANLAELEIVFRDWTNAYKESEIIPLLRNMYHLCIHVGKADLVHRTKRALRSLGTVEISLEKLIAKGKEDEATIELLLESAADMIERAVRLGELDFAEEMIERLSSFIEKRSELFSIDSGRRKIQLARFYSNCMIRYCSIYDVKRAEVYFNKAEAVLGEPESYDSLIDKYYELKGALVHNYLGVFRNYDPEKTLIIAERLIEDIRTQAPSFSKVNDYLMAALCCRSAHRMEQSESLLLKACDLMEYILQERKISYKELLNPYEQEIYIHVYWRLCQTLNEKLQKDLHSVSFAELKLAIYSLDEFISCLIIASETGYGHLDLLRFDLMTTAALLRNMIACKMSLLPFSFKRSLHVKIKTAHDYKLEALQAAAIIEKAYESIKEAGVNCDKINTMFNLMNCACVYSGFGENTRSIALLDKILTEYIPENEQETMVCQLVKRKRQEIFSQCIRQ